MTFAVFIMVFNEPDFLPIWIEHYGREFGYETLFVIDHGTTDNSLKNLPIVNIIRLERNIDFDEENRSQLISAFFNELLMNHEYVIFTDVDELLAVDPRNNVSLKKYILNSGSDYLTAKGLNVIHNMNEESPLDPRLPLFLQRQYVEFDYKYCKTLISRLPIVFRAGFHNVMLLEFFNKGNYTYQFNFHEQLYLFHLRAVDQEIAKKRLLNYNSIKISQNALMKRHAVQFSLNWSEYRDKYFLRNFEDATSVVIDPILISAKDAWIRLNNTGRYEENKPIIRIPTIFKEIIPLLERPFKAYDRPSEINFQQEGTLVFAKALKKLIESDKAKYSRNSLCPCSSGHKVKNCHGKLS